MFFTGDLQQTIYTNPFYFEKELVYLRAQIARITASTTLVPKTIYKFVDESNEREIEEFVPEEGEFLKPNIQQMQNKEMWLHFYPSILK